MMKKLGENMSLIFRQEKKNKNEIVIFVILIILFVVLIPFINLGAIKGKEYLDIKPILYYNNDRIYYLIVQGEDGIIYKENISEEEFGQRRVGMEIIVQKNELQKFVIFDFKKCFGDGKFYIIRFLILKNVLEMENVFYRFLLLKNVLEMENCRLQSNFKK